MRNWKNFGLIVIGIFFLACSSLTIYRDFDHSVDFSRYHKYSWYEGDTLPGDQLARHPLIKKRIQATVDRILVEKGFQKVDSRQQYDFLVLVHAGVEQKTETEDWSVREFDRPRWLPPDDDFLTVDQYEEGTLIVDIIDSKENRLVWRGMAKKVLSDYRQPEQLQKTVDKMVSHILDKFPPVKIENKK